MRVAFIAHRVNYLKHYGPIIDAALERGWEPECWVLDADGKGKAYLRISPDTVRSIWPENVHIEGFQHLDQVKDLVNRRRVDALISLHPRNLYFSGSNETRFLTLQHSVDTFVDDYADLATSDFVCLVSPFWWEYGVRYYAEAQQVTRSELERVLLPKVVFTGFPQMDAFGRIDREKVRQRLELQNSDSVVLVMPIDLAGWDGIWPRFFAAAGLQQWRALAKANKEPGFVDAYWRWAAAGWNDKKLAKVIRQFCDRNNARLLIKGREKDPLRTAWIANADFCFYDEAHYPPTVFELITIADLCITFYSTAIQEAAYANVPSLCVDRPNRDTLKHKLWRTNSSGGPYNFPGVVQWQSLPAFMGNFSKQSLDEFAIDEKARKEYLAIYNGPADHRASQRVLDLIQ